MTIIQFIHFDIGNEIDLRIIGPKKINRKCILLCTDSETMRNAWVIIKSQKGSLTNERLFNRFIAVSPKSWVFHVQISLQMFWIKFKSNGIEWNGIDQSQTNPKLFNSLFWQKKKQKSIFYFLLSRKSHIKCQILRKHFESTW